VIINAENAAAGFGITEATARELFDAGADCLTLGNHSWDQKEALTYIVREPRLIRPLNYSAFSAAPGRGAQLFETASGKQILVINPLGRVNMDSLDDPFAAVDKALEDCPWAPSPTPSWWISMPRPPRKRWPWATSVMAAPASWWAPTPTCDGRLPGAGGRHRIPDRCRRLR